MSTQVRRKVALHSKDVKVMIKLVMDTDPEVAALISVSRLFRFRVPSEALPLQWNGERSSVQLYEGKAVVTLAKRKNTRAPSELVRECCCPTSGRTLCAVHWLHRLRELAPERNQVFETPLHRFRQTLVNLAREAGVVDWCHVSTHSFRRGMAQDIIDTGCLLSVLFRAGGWSSSAYTEYLRQDQGCEAAVGQAVIMLSDSEDDV